MYSFDDFYYCGNFLPEQLPWELASVQIGHPYFLSWFCWTTMLKQEFIIKITSKILYINQNDTWQENQGNKTLHRNRVPIHKITERCTYLCCHNHWQTCFFQTLHYLLRSEEKSNRCTFHGPNSWFLQQRQKYSCHLRKYRVHCTYVVVSFINFDRDLHAMLFSTYKNSIKSTPIWNAYPIYIQTISYAIAKMLQKCLILLPFD